MARPQLLTAELVAEVAAILPRVLYVETAAAQLGITRETFRQWLKAGAKERRDRERGRKPNRKLDLHCEFSAAVKKALAESEAEHLERIKAAGATAWTASAWVLERRFPQRWATNRGELRALAKQIATLLGNADHAQPGPRPGQNGVPPRADDRESVR